MSIIKNINNVKPFESIPRELLQQCDKKRSNTKNKPLSLQAIGLLCNLQSYPEDWELHKTELYNRYEKNGRRQIQNAWNELVDANYIIQFKIYDGNKLDYYYYFSVNPITDEQIKELEDFHNSERLNRFDLTHKNPTVQNEQYRHDGDSSTVHSVQYNLYSTDVNSTKRTVNRIHNQHNTHKYNTHKYNTHENTTHNKLQNKTNGSSSYSQLLNLVEKDFKIKMTKSYKDKLLTLFDYFDKEVLEYAIYYSSIYGNNPKSLLLAILDKWKIANINNVEDAKSYKVSKTNIINFSREKTPEWLKERNNKEKVNNAEEKDPQLEKDREAFLAQLKKDWEE
ncbi:conserved hypothetical protein protein (plasmid) [Staphylococcus epidermidis PM221]|uniref:DnaD domain-containing protein n=1 Tax=Staphylococcus epidermidis TaxID=1282 RepID=UPI0004E60065|nr:DnaD domain protein [Staphylococcus epidermidis]CDM14986.1 conserved hypothetical protein protein [Staphylococcus epidermidis PM221]